jgi:hypothetical protein
VDCASVVGGDFSQDRSACCPCSSNVSGGGAG